MSACLLDGNKIRDEILAELSRDIAALAADGIKPGLAAMLVGENPGSEIYVRSKVRTCGSLGLHSETVRRPATATTGELVELVADLNRRDDIDGILVQLPLPAHVDARRVLESVDPAKDVDGFHPLNAGHLLAGRAGFVPCTPAGIIEILRRSRIPLAGARAVVIGRSDIVGKPTAILLLRENTTVTICHSKTRDLAAVARQADILVAAIGRPAFITGDFIKAGATVIDVGVNRLTTEDEVRRAFPRSAAALAQLASKGSVLVGDVQPNDATEQAGALTPVPGGVGPLTIAMLMSNTVAAAQRRRARPAKTDA